MIVYTLGHSTHTTEELVRILTAHGVRRIVDVRRFPASRRHPHLAREPLAAALQDSGIDYVWMEALGGRRSRRKDSPHTGWREPGFAGYADYMDTSEFAKAGEELLARAAERPTAILCAEAVPERCHRRLIADWLTTRGATVEHLLTPKRARRHVPTAFMRQVGARLLYDAGDLFGA